MAVDINDLAKKMNLKENITENFSTNRQKVDKSLEKAKAKLNDFYIKEAQSRGITNAYEIIESGENISDYIFSESDVQAPNVKQADKNNKSQDLSASNFKKQENTMILKYKDTVNNISKTSADLFVHQADLISQNDVLINEINDELKTLHKELEEKNTVLNNATTLKAQLDKELEEIRKEEKENIDKLEKAKNELATSEALFEPESVISQLESKCASLQTVLDKSTSKKGKLEEKYAANEEVIASIAPRVEVLTDMDLGSMALNVQKFSEINEKEKVNWQTSYDGITEKFSEYGIDMEENLNNAIDKRDNERQDISPEETKPSETKKDATKSTYVQEEQDRAEANVLPKVQSKAEISKNLIEEYMNLDENSRRKVLSDSNKYSELMDALDDAKSGFIGFNNATNLKNIAKLDGSYLTNMVNENENDVKAIISKVLDADVLQTAKGGIYSSEINDIYNEFYSTTDEYGKAGKSCLLDGTLSKSGMLNLRKIVNSYNEKAENGEMTKKEMQDFNLYISNPAMCGTLKKETDKLGFLGKIKSGFSNLSNKFNGKETISKDIRNSLQNLVSAPNKVSFFEEMKAGKVQDNHSLPTKVHSKTNDVPTR